jgi:hypothetical protein
MSIYISLEIFVSIENKRDISQQQQVVRFIRLEGVHHSASNQTWLIARVGGNFVYNYPIST